MSHSPSHEPPRKGWIVPVFLLIAAFFLFSEHRTHLFGVLPYLLLLACPLMHLFMHHGHDGHGGHGRHQLDPARPEPPRRDDPSAEPHDAADRPATKAEDKS